jgi:hypothetical protein
MAKRVEVKNKGIPQEDGTIFCQKCNGHFSPTHFFKRTSSIKTNYYCYKNKEREKKSSWEHKLKTFFKITTDVYFKMLSQQNNCCAICNRHEKEFNKKLSIDHNHDTKQIRGLLCTTCNHGIGLLQENINLIYKTISYLNKPSLQFTKDIINKKYTTKDVEYYSDRCFKKRYGINFQDYINILQIQENCCGVCSLPKEQYHKNMAVDHCHETGDIRGILCNNCNAGMGCFGDNPETLLNAINYLTKYNS